MDGRSIGLYISAFTDFDVSKYGLIGGAQKNLAPAGVTFVIVKDEISDK
jgi:phosphoserine aminotransferase